MSRLSRSVIPAVLLFSIAAFAAGCTADAADGAGEAVDSEAEALQAADEALDADENTPDSDDSVTVADDEAEPTEDPAEPEDGVAPASEGGERLGTTSAELKGDGACGAGCIRVVTANVYFGAMYPKGWRQVKDAALCPGRTLTKSCDRSKGAGARQAKWVTFGIAQGLADEVKRIGGVAIVGAQETNNPNAARTATKADDAQDWGRKHIIAQEIARRLKHTTGQPWRYDNAPASCVTGRINDPGCEGLGPGATVFWRDDLLDLEGTLKSPRGPALVFKEKGGKRFIFHTALLTGKHGDGQAQRVSAWAKASLTVAPTLISVMDMNEPGATGVRGKAFRSAGFTTTRKHAVKGVPWIDYIWVNRASGFVKFQQVAHPFGSDHRARWADVRLR